MEKHKHTCPTCGQSVSQHTHRFTKAMAQILLKAASRFTPADRFHLQKDLELTNNQYNNFQKLKYWNLITKAHKDGKRLGGYWALTFDAEQLIIYGRSIPKWVKTFNNQPVEFSEETVSLKDAVGYYDLPEVWASRAQSAFADRGQLKLF